MSQTMHRGARTLSWHRGHFARKAECVAVRPPSRLEPDETALVRETALFSGLSDGAAADLLAQTRAYDVTAGSTVYADGDPADAVYVVLSGKLQAYRDDEYGRSRILRIVAVGEMFGYFSIVDHLPRSATISALCDSRVAVLAGVQLDRLLESEPRAALKMIGYLAARLRTSNEAVADMALMDVRARVTKMVLELSARFGSPHPAGLLVDHGLSQQDLARYVGASREMVNRALSDLQTRGVIEVRPGAMLLVHQEHETQR